MENPQLLFDQLKSLLASQYLAVLATSHEGHPYTNLVAFAPADDLRHLIFFTSRSTRKVANIQSDPRASMLIDNRSNQASDIVHAMAATATGSARAAAESELADFRARHLAIHPHMESFVNSPSTMCIVFEVDRYYIVDHFQRVSELEMGK